MANEQQQQTIRVPLVGGPTTRAGETLTSFASSGYVGLGVVGVMIVGYTSAQGKDQRFLNTIPDKIVNPFTKKERYYVFKRPGFETNTTPAAGNGGTAIRVWAGQGSGDKIVTAFGTTNSTIYDGITSLGAITGVARDITETTVGTTATLVIPVDNSKAYYYPDAGALTEIVDVDYPGNAGQTTVGTFVHVDGYSFIMTLAGRIYNSDLNSISSWSATGYITANMYPDKGIGLVRYKEFIVAFGRESMELFRNVGNPLGSPLQRVNEGFFRLGALSATSICQFEDNVAFVASSDIGNVSVYVIDKGEPKRISNTVIDTQLSLRASNTVYMTAVKLFGKTLILVMIGSGITFVYSVEDDTWHEWTGNAIRWHKFAANTAASPNVYSISRDVTDGKVYKINPNAPVYQDDGFNYSLIIQTSVLDFETEKRKFLNRLTVVADRATTSSNLIIGWTDDDYNSFSTARTVDISSVRRYLDNCGSFRRRAFRLIHSDAYAIRLEALEMDLTEGLH